MIGFTDNYLKVQVKSKENIENQILEVELKEVSKLGNMKAVLVSDKLANSNTSISKEIINKL